MSTFTAIAFTLSVMTGVTFDKRLNDACVCTDRNRTDSAWCFIDYAVVLGTLQPYAVLLDPVTLKWVPGTVDIGCIKEVDLEDK
jgi:hypothetical protein